MLVFNWDEHQSLMYKDDISFNQSTKQNWNVFEIKIIAVKN